MTEKKKLTLILVELFIWLVIVVGLILCIYMFKTTGTKLYGLGGLLVFPMLFIDIDVACYMLWDDHCWRML
jgi:hypothetical protein